MAATKRQGRIVVEKSDDIRIKISQFEGPLDLLLHLININEVDIYDIPISEITSQYVAYLKQLKALDLEIAGEFIVMASTLMRIKSEWLLPRQEVDVEVEEDEFVDPRKELSDRLAEYQLYKDISYKLDQFKNERQNYFVGQPVDLSEYQKTIPLEPAEVDLNDLVQAVFRVVRRRAMLQTPKTSIQQEVESIEDKIDYIRKLFTTLKTNRIVFTQLINKPSRFEIVNSFLAVLELMKQQEILVYQENAFADIEIILKRQGESPEDEK